MRLPILSVLLCTCLANAQTPVKELIAAAKTGDVASEVAVADAYYHGNGTRQNYHKAAEWYAAAAHDGSGYAYYMVGLEHFLGQLPETLGVLKISVPSAQEDMEQAQWNMSLAANLNYGPACGWLGWYYEEGYRMGKSAGDISSETTIQPPSQSSQPQGGGSATAGFFGALAADIAHKNGDDQTKIKTSTSAVANANYVQAAMWYRRGADQGDISSEYNLGRLYENGLGVPRDMALAMKWYTVAASHGNRNAQTRLELLKDTPTPTTP